MLYVKYSWCQQLTLTPEEVQELSFWCEKTAKYNGQGIRPKPSAVRVVYSDASSIGCGGYLVEHDSMVASGQWSEAEALQSSTWQELRAVIFVLESFQSQLANEWVR